MSESVQWQIIVSRKAERALRRLPRDLLQRIRRAIDELETNPRPAGYKKLVGSDFYRVRVGDWRIVYVIEDDRLIVLIVTVAPRGTVYKDLWAVLSGVILISPKFSLARHPKVRRKFDEIIE